jgi:hypothetical protein
VWDGPNSFVKGIVEMQKTKEHIEQLLRLIKENPTLKILPMVDCEVVASDKYEWWPATFGEASIEEVYQDDERVYIRYYDESSLVEKEADRLVWVDNALTSDEAFERAEKTVDGYEWEKVIVVKIIA